MLETILNICYNPCYYTEYTQRQQSIQKIQQIQKFLKNQLFSINLFILFLYPAPSTMFLKLQ